ncbi:MAG: hypothetical protein IJ122_07440 [Methanobrevibacter sp.]|nr:hypothetical protein [Methanobrevibacter sp.]
MLFKTIEEFNKELTEMQNEIDDTEEYLKKHPKEYGTRGNFKTMKELYEIFKQDKINFINDLNDMDLKLKGDELRTPLLLPDMYSLGNAFTMANHSVTNLLTETNLNEELTVKEVSLGSYNIKFAFQNPTEDDVTRKSPRKQGLVKLFDYIKCGEDIEKLKKEAGPDGKDSLIAYRNFLKEIVENHADFTLSTEKGTLKAGLALEQSKFLCENLNI